MGTEANAYREPGARDETTIECARAHEEGETARKKLEMKVEARKQWIDAWMKSDAMKAMVVFPTIFVAATCCTIAILFCVHLWWPSR